MFSFRFLVNIRDEKTLAVKEGCKVWDMGYKLGLNGVDNAALWFHNVRVPRQNLLNATSNMDEKGVFTSKIHDKSARRRKRSKNNDFIFILLLVNHFKIRKKIYCISRSIVVWSSMHCSNDYGFNQVAIRSNCKKNLIKFN